MMNCWPWRYRGSPNYHHRQSARTWQSRIRLHAGGAGGGRGVVVKAMEFPSWLLSVVTPLVSALVAAIVALVTVHLNLRNFYRQRWWEKKAEVYSLIMESLVSMRLYLREKGLCEMGEIALSEEDEQQLHVGYMQGVRAIERTVAAGAFIVSSNASRSLGGLISKLEEVPKVEKSTYNPGGYMGLVDYVEYLIGQCDEVEACIESVRKCANVDLKLGVRWWWLLW